MSTPSVSPEDRSILQTALGLMAQVRLQGTLLRVDWVERIRLRRVWPDYVAFFRGAIKMPSVMRGSLTIDDWRPLIAASLIFAAFKSPRRAWRFITILGTLEGLILTIVKYNTDTTTGFTIATFIVISLAGIILGVLRYTKTLWLQADTQASSLVGKDRFVASLTKIRAMDLAGIDSNRGFSIPKLEERIENLLRPGN